MTSEREKDTEAERKTLNRRRLLATMSGMMTALAGCSALEDDERTPTTEDATPPTTTDTGTTGTETPDSDTEEIPTSTGEIQFDRVLDAVDDLGCDPSGEQPCDSAIAGSLTNGTLVKFPAGRYRFERGHQFPEIARLGFHGEGSVTFVPPKGFNGKLIGMMGDYGSFRGIDIDVRAENTTAGIRATTKSGFLVEDVEFIGRGQHSDDQVVNALSLAVKNPDATGTVRHVTARKGSAIGHYKDGNGRVAMWIGHRHRGHITVENSHLEEFGNNGIYASRNRGSTEVKGGFFRNNNISSVRLGGGGNVLRDATIVIDVDKYTGPKTNVETDYNTRAIVIEQGPYDKTGRVRIEDTDIKMRNADRTQGSIVAWPSGNGPRIERTTIESEVDWAPAIRGLSPLPRVTLVERPFLINETTITGAGNHGSAMEFRERPWSMIERTRIEQTGSDRDGLQLISSNPCTITASSITTSRYPIYAITPDGGTDQCLLYVETASSLERTDPVPDTLRSSELGALDPWSLQTLEVPYGNERRCIGKSIHSELDDAQGIAITAINDGTVSWIHNSAIETAVRK